MFVMMNAARLHVGLQGLGHLEMAAQNARRYAMERRQMRAGVRRADSADTGADPISRHPAMRLKLRTLQATAEGLRVVAYQAALCLDIAHGHPDEAQRVSAATHAAFFTPVIKAFGTHLGFQGASEALQVFGGYGYVRETGVEQSVRDARIALVYEGTNEIQAIDLLTRKVLVDGGAQFEAWLDWLGRDAAPHDEYGVALEDQLASARHAVSVLYRAQPDDPEAPWRVADDFLMGVGYLLLAWAWARVARAAAQRAERDGDTAPWAAQRQSLVRHGIAWILPQARVHWQRVEAAASLGEVSA
jgi:hypothetical protein